MSGKVFITGDKHGSFRMFFGLQEKQAAGAEDVLIIAGDAGYVMKSDYMLKIRTIEQLFPGTVCFIDGNHENHELLSSLPVSEWNGGRVHRLSERVLHLLRGEIFDICGSRFFVLGGARSVGNHIEGLERFRGEEPTPEEISCAQEKLYSNLGTVDYVITHEAPVSARAVIPRSKRIDKDYMLPKTLQGWLDALSQSPRFKCWYFGHMHVDMQISPDLRAVFNNVVDVETNETVRWG